ncbi:MAG: M23 family metallopeptidase, partial [Halieaceae bacterium]|nr:M23 family metallopeptidase [Halieaceae bacterium]
VRKGDVIALMGSSGRSTGAHVHYEVFKNGRSVDPSSYVSRTHP